MYIKDDPYASYKLLKIEFLKKGYEVSEEVRDDGRRFVTYTSPAGKQWRTRAALLRYPCVSEQARYISRNKEVAYKFAHKHGVSIPYTRYIQPDETIGAEDAARLLAQHKNLIVKPSNTSLSRGLTLTIRTQQALEAAILKARKVAPTVLVQEQVEGEEIRFMVMNGKVVSALLRRTARVTGDGTSTLAQLIEQENAARRQLQFEYLSYPQLSEENIPAELLTSQRVPARGEVVELNRATMIKNGCSVYDIASDIHSSYMKLVEGLCQQLDTKFIVVDMFVKDYTQPKAARNHWFIEFNTSPVLKLFYGCRNGKMFDMVPKLADNIDKTLHAKKKSPRVVVGGFESIVLPDYSPTSIVAKIDTGAYSGALYATHVRKKVDEHGRSYLSFALCGNQAQLCTSYDFYQRKVRSAHGHVQSRYVIRTYVKIQDQLYETDIGLSNRSNMKYPMLIGRKFLRDYEMLVDVIVNDEMDYEKELLG